MGAGASIVSSASRKSLAATQDLVLSQVQKDMLSETWNAALKSAGLLAVGQEIFFRILIRGRKIRQLFGLELVSDDKLRNNEKFMDHANKIGSMLGKLVVDFTNDELKFRRDAQRLAATHFAMMKAGFNPMYWSIFPTILGEVMLVHTPDVLRSSNESAGRVREDCKEAWTTFADIMVDFMQAAYIASAKKYDKKDQNSVLRRFFNKKKDKDKENSKDDKKNSQLIVQFG